MKRVMRFINSSTRADSLEIIFRNKPCALPDPDTCFGKLILTTTRCYKEFRKDFDVVIDIQGDGYERT